MSRFQAARKHQDLLICGRPDGLAAHRNYKHAALAETVDVPKKRARNAFQIGALVYRWNAGEFEVLIVTSRETRRWILPKGWPMAGKTAAATAAREADEEAGIIGHVVKKPLGRFATIKRIGETALPSEVEVYALQFIKQKQKWKERGERICLWLPAMEAANTVAEPDLAAIIRAFAEEAYRAEKAPRSA